MISTTTDPHPAGPVRFIGRAVSFQHGGKTLRGNVEAAEYAGRTERGDIPDTTLTVRGASGRTMTISLVETHARFSDDDTPPTPPPSPK